MIRLRFTYLAAALLAACSAVEDNRMPDAPVADVTPPTIMVSTPANMAKRVSVLEPIVVQFDEDIDPATVTAASVVLSYVERDRRYYGNDFALYRDTGPGMAPKHPVPGTVSYDAVSRTLRFVPKAPLPYGEHFTLAFTAKDLAANGLTATVEFRTAVNGEVRSRSFDTMQQPVPNYVERVLDANGFQTTHIVRSGPGTNGTWYDDDDDVARVYQTVFSPDGVLQFDWFITAGMDAKLNTPDDVKFFGWEHRYSATGQLQEHILHDAGTEGPDMMFGTPDDLITYLETFTYMNEQPTLHVVYVADGAVDDVWRTPDDQCANQYFMTYDTAGHRTREVVKDCGSDSLPTNADDDFQLYYDFQYDVNHVLTRRTTRDTFGGNMTWLDDDDGISEIDVNTVDPKGLVTESRVYTDPGINTTWEGSGDDVIGSLLRITYDANGQSIEVTTYAPGMDSKLGTPDDVIRNYTRTSYDALGNRVSSKSYDTGPDAIAYSGDDRLVTDVRYDTMH